MNTGHYITPSELIFNAAAFAGDTKHEYVPRGFYMSLIRDAFRELNMASKFTEKRENFKLPQGHLTLPLPEDCFDVENIYMFTGNDCTFEDTKKVYWKKNYYTEGDGYIANDKWINKSDPYFENHEFRVGAVSPLLNKPQAPRTRLLYYNIQMGNLMLSSSCRDAGDMVHIHYRSTGSTAMDSPIIPIFFKTAIEEFVTEAALRFRIANEPQNAKQLTYLHQDCKQRLDKEGMRGSWHQAIYLARTMNDSQRNELNMYLARGGWAPGR
jgi:hypothetical protein